MTIDLEEKMRTALERALKTHASRSACRGIDENWQTAYHANRAAQQEFRQLFLAWLNAYVEARDGFEANVMLTSEYLGITEGHWCPGTICFWKGTDINPRAWVDKIKISFSYFAIGAEWHRPLLGSTVTARAATRQSYAGAAPYEIQKDVTDMMARVARGILYDISLDNGAEEDQ